MNFSSIPAYLDPSNWQQQGGGSISNHHQLTSPPSQTGPPPPPLPPPPPPVVPLQPHGGSGGGGGGAGSIRPGSMADRARMANMPMPEMALKCPRCDSTNTKFCYFNNYSLSQPRHFCKACKRYWTRGGALRNVPVGGGCRRNKRSSSSKSNSNNNNNNSNKSPASSTSTDGRQATNNSGSTSTISSHSNSLISGPTSSAASLLGLMNPQIPPPLRFMSPLGQFSTTSDHHHNHHHHHFTPSNNNHMNLDFSTSTCGNVLGGTETTECVMVNNTNNFLGVGAGAGVASILSSGNLEHWRMQQQFIPNFLAGFDPSNSPSSGVNNYPFHQGGVHESVQFLGGDQSRSQINRPKISTSMLNQMASVKMEDNNHNNNNNDNNQDHQSALSRQLLGIQGNNDQNWNTASAWSDLSASFSSSSTSNAL